MLTYQEALDYIYSFVDYERTSLEGPHRFDLSRITALLELLDQPHRRYKAVHIAGTKGKGSTAAMIESILRAAGYKTGLFTSPHLHTYRERIQTGGQLVTEEQLVAHVERLIPLAKRFAGLTTFEITTALAFSHFAQEKIEWAILETGLGGRLDTTNVVDPKVVVITLIGYDHTEILGHRLGEIAKEKAGIIKKGRPVVCAPQRPTALKVIKRVCREQGAPLTLVSRDWKWERLAFDLEGQRLTIRCHKNSASSASHKDYVNLWLPFLGEHQLVNATTAVAAVAELEEAPFPPESIMEGLKNTSWPGRLELLNQKPLLVIDGAHNVDSARALAKGLRDYLPYEHLILVLGFSADKDIDGIFQELLPLAYQVIITQSRHPRAADIDLLKEKVRARGWAAIPCWSTEEALWQAMGLARGQDLVCVTGSLFVAAEVRATWLESRGISFERDPPPTW